MARSAEQGRSTVLVPKEALPEAPLPIHTLGASALRTSARRISKVDESVRDLARDMLRSMYTAKGIGLAAPQVGVAKQLLVIDLDLEEAATPPLVLINPEITATGSSLNTYEEGCLSIPKVYLNVVRPSVVEVSFRDELGRPRKLKADGLLARDDHGTLHVPNPDLLLDAWAEAYDFERHDILRGHVAARSGEALVHDLARGLREAGLEFAATGLAAAWLATHFAGFRTTSIYLAAAPSAAVLDSLGFRDDPRGANVWLVVPRDEGVFHGATDYDGLRCVHPVQTWLDLRAHPERAAEAADHLRRQLLTWGRDA